jgi:predicted component of type VI protein secretion system
VDVGVLQRFERRLEGLVSGAFAKAFKADVQPVEIASGLQRELDDRAAIVGKGNTLVPNHFVVELSRHDFDRLSVYAKTLSDELAEVVRDHSAEQRYQLQGDVKVIFEEDPDLDIGVHRIRSSVVASVTSVPPPQSQPRPAAAPVPVPQRQPQPAHHAAKTEKIALARAAVPYLEVNGERHPLTRPVTVLGRGTQVDLRIDDAGVSRRHAEIQLGDSPMLVDLGSTNGTTLDGAPVGRAELTDGSRIGMGDTVLVFRLPAG